MFSKDRRRRLPVAAVAASLVLLATVSALPALAGVTGGCDGQAVIDGTTYTPANDTPDNPIVIPDRDDVVATWSGSVPFANTNFRGDAGIRVGPVVVTLAEWEGANEEDIRSESGEYSLDELQSALPVDVGVAGIYEVIVNHQADGGSCRGNVIVVFEGDPLSTPLGVFAVAGLVLTGLGLVGSMFAKKE